MAGTAGVDYPEERSVVDLLASSRGDALISWVESSGDGEIVVTIGEDRSRRRVRLPDGEHVEVIWRGPEELRARPTELVATQLDPPHWRLRPVGPATRGQRRSSVRAPVGVQVQITAGGELRQGATLDISEGGVRAVFGPVVATLGAPPTEPSAPVTAGPDPADPDPAAPDPLMVGAVLPLVVCLDGDELPCRGEVVRRFPRQDDRVELSLRFIGMHEKMQDQIRRHVFMELRNLRARGML